MIQLSKEIGMIQRQTGISLIHSIRHQALRPLHMEQNIVGGFDPRCFIEHCLFVRASMDLNSVFSFHWDDLIEEELLFDILFRIGNIVPSATQELS